MQCPYCGEADSKVTDSREVKDAADKSDGIRRRRECLTCKRRFSTFERREPAKLLVIKRDQHTEPFSGEKIVRALRRVCRGLSVDERSLIELARLVETHFVDAGIDARGRTIHSSDVAEQVLTRLQAIDRVAYQRMAVNYLDPDGRLRTSPSEPSADADKQPRLPGVDD